MSILVTGAAGFIGSNLCWKLTELGYDVVGIDAFKIGSNRKNLQGWKGRLLEIDILNKTALDQLVKENTFEEVIHLAAETHVDRSFLNIDSFWSTNVLGTSNLLQCFLGRPPRIFINQLSDEAYGPIDFGQSVEGDPFYPTSPYAASKAAQYFVGQSFYKTFNLPVVSTFPSNTFGPRQWPEKLIPKFTLRLINSLPVPLMKSVENRRDWLSVEDHVAALIFLLKKGAVGSSYNISAENQLTNLAITKHLLFLTGRDDSYIELVPDRLAHDYAYNVSSAILHLMGWAPKQKFETYLKSTVEWYYDHQDYYPPGVYS